MIIAEGHGVIHDGIKNFPFLWTIPFYPQTLSSQSSEENPSDFPSIYPINLDFLGEDNVEQSLFDAIAARLLDCANSSFGEGPITLQSPNSVMTSLLHSEYNREGRPQDEIDHELLDMYWWDLIFDRDSNEQFDIHYRFIQALTRCWEIGETYTFRIMR
jgi:hypothetical protein